MDGIPSFFYAGNLHHLVATWRGTFTKSTQVESKEEKGVKISMKVNDGGEVDKRPKADQLVKDFNKEIKEVVISKAYVEKT